MKLLGLDTSTEWCSVAVWADGAVHQRELGAGARHAEVIFDLVDQMLAEAGLSLVSLDGIAFGHGPGSFTGLRVACAVTQGLALGADLPVRGIGSLEAMAADCGAERVIACLDARMQEVYAAAFERTPQGWTAAGDTVVCPPSAVPLPPGGQWTGCGSGFAAYPALAARLAPALQAVRQDVWPRAAQIAGLAAPAFARGEGLPPEAAVPVYVRNKVALTVAERA